MRVRQNIPLFWKFAIAIVSTVTIFGTINLYFTNYAVYELYESELIRHGKTSAIIIAERSINPIIYNDPVTLNNIVSSQKNIDPSLAYIFITDKIGNVIAHTFDYAVPVELLNMRPYNKIMNLSALKIVDKHNHDIVILDIVVPILNGDYGFVRIGLNERDYRKSIINTSRKFILMIGMFVVFGIIGALFFSYIITKPIKIISNISRRIELGTLDIQEDDVESTLLKTEIVKWKNILSIKDEIDVLISSFGEMVSRLKNTYEDLKKTERYLVHSEKMASLGTLSAGLAHEINNPIAGVKNCIRRLKESPENIKQNTSYLELMEDAVNRIELVVGGLLNFSKKPKLLFTNINLTEVIDNVLLLSEFQLEESQIKVNKTYKNEPNFIIGSSNQIEQVVLNVILNSIDSIDEKKFYQGDYTGEISISISQSESSMCLDISDNGGGVPSDLLKDIFDPFFTLKKIRKGTGLGLAVCFNIMEQHKGKIECRNIEEGGLLISLLFPTK